jgi:hypothetical protein
VTRQPDNALTGGYGVAGYYFNVMCVEDNDCNIGYICANSTGSIFQDNNGSVIIPKMCQLASPANPNLILNTSRLLYRKPIILNTAKNINDFSVNLTVDTASIIANGSHLQSDCSDLFFADIFSNKIGYWVESGCNTPATKIWLYTNLTNSTIYMYYGNIHGTASSLSNMRDAFLLADDFEGDTVDTSYWSVSNVGSITIIPSITQKYIGSKALLFNASTDTAGYIYRTLPASLNPYDDYEISIWYYDGTSANSFNAFGFGSTLVTNSIMSKSDDSTSKVMYRGDGGSYSVSDVSLCANCWQQWSVKFSPQNGSYLINDSYPTRKSIYNATVNNSIFINSYARINLGYAGSLTPSWNKYYDYLRLRKIYNNYNAIIGEEEYNPNSPYIGQEECTLVTSAEGYFNFINLFTGANETWYAPLYPCAVQNTIICKRLAFDNENCGKCGYSCNANEVCYNNICRSNTTTGYGNSITIWVSDSLNYSLNPVVGARVLIDGKESTGKFQYTGSNGGLFFPNMEQGMHNITVFAIYFLNKKPYPYQEFSSTINNSGYSIFSFQVVLNRQVLCNAVVQACKKTTCESLLKDYYNQLNPIGINRTLCAYGADQFGIDNPDYVSTCLSRSGNRWTGFICYPNQILPANVYSSESESVGGIGYNIGESVGGIFGGSATIGLGIISLAISIVLTIIAGFLTNNGMVSGVVFLCSIMLFLLAGWLPFWIAVLLVIIAGFIVVKMSVGIFGGGGG